MNNFCAPAPHKIYKIQKRKGIMQDSKPKRSTQKTDCRRIMQKQSSTETKEMDEHAGMQNADKARKELYIRPRARARAITLLSLDGENLLSSPFLLLETSFGHSVALGERHRPDEKTEHHGKAHKTRVEDPQPTKTEGEGAQHSRPLRRSQR